MHFFPEKFESFFSNDLKLLCWLTSSCHALNIHLNLKHASSYRFRKKKQGFAHFSLYKATSFTQEPIFEGFCRQYNRLDSKQ